MVSHTPAPAGSVLQRVSNTSSHTFEVPSKKIHDGEDLSFFLSSIAYRDLITWLLQLNRSMFPTKSQDGTIQDHKLNSPPSYSHTVQSLRGLILDLQGLLEKAPPDTGPRRFGNVAFKTWYRLAGEGVDDLLDSHLEGVMRPFSTEQKAQMKEELKYYLLGSLGSAQRLDYGTGHELSFLAFLGCLWKLGAFQEGEEGQIVLGVIQPYLELIRRLVLTYTLEPAGSHGVWGLDDHSFVPYIFGSAQYGPPVDPSNYSTPLPTEGSLTSAPSPSKVTNKELVAHYKDSNMYFSAIQFIYDVKRGPFWEHSPVLYDVSGIKDGWAKINKGMLKMFAAEVLGKFPVVQHFGFGSLWRWEADPDAIHRQASLHAQQQPIATGTRSMDVPPPPASTGGGTKAPWASSGSSMNMPTTRAPWTAGGAGGRVPHSVGSAAAARVLPNQHLPAASTGMAPTVAPWAANRGTSTGGSKVPDTTASWAKKEGG